MGLEIINELRKKKGLTSEQLSIKSGVPIGTLNKILNGTTKDPKLETLKALARVLGCRLDDFDDNQNKKTSNESLPVIPEEFTNPEAARAYIARHQIFGSEGFDVNKLSDEEILNFANELLSQMKLVGYKYKK